MKRIEKLEKEVNALYKAMDKAQRAETDFYRKHISKKKKPDPAMVKKDRALIEKAVKLEMRAFKKANALAALKKKK